MRWLRSTSLAVDPAGQRRLGQAGADRCGHVGHRHGAGNSRFEPSGNVIEIIGFDFQETKKRGRDRAFVVAGKGVRRDGAADQVSVKKPVVRGVITMLPFPVLVSC